MCIDREGLCPVCRGHKSDCNNCNGTGRETVNECVFTTKIKSKKKRNGLFVPSFTNSEEVKCIHCGQKKS
jgi:hypothetical protein